MKFKLPAGLLAVCLLLGISSCVDNNKCSDTNLTAQINVSPFTSCTITASAVGNRIQINAQENEPRAYRSIQLILPNAVGHYTIGQQGVDDTYASTSLAGAQPVEYVSDSLRTGTLDITTFDATNHKASGTFSFAAYDHTGVNGTKTVTNGVFTDVKW